MKDKSTKIVKGVAASTSGERGTLLGLYPLTNAALQEIGKKEKTQTQFAFSLSGLGRETKGITIFCAENQGVVDKFVGALQSSFYLANRSIFGTTIRDACLKSNKQVPDIVLTSIERIRPHVKTEGLFRVSGDQELIQSLSDAFDRGEVPTDIMLKHDVHLTAGLLKSYFRNLSEPLFPHIYYNELLAVTSLPPDQQRDALARIVQSLPPENLIVLHYLLKFLIQLSGEKETNKMDNKNISVVFGPTIIRSEIVEKSTTGPSKETLDSVALAALVFQLMMENLSIFPPVEDSFFGSQIIDPAVEIAKLSRRRFSTQSELAMIESYLKPHMDSIADDQWAISAGWLVNVVVAGSKQRLPEPKIVVIDRHRIYFFQQISAKCEFDVHFYELLECSSPDKFTLNLCWLSGKTMTAVTISPISYMDLVVEAILAKLFAEYSRNFTGRDFDNLKRVIEPAERLDNLMKNITVSKAECGGFIQTYLTLCDHYPYCTDPNVINDLSEYFHKNKITEFFLEDFLSPSTRERFLNPEFEILAICLRYNTWFKLLTCDNNPLSNDGLAFIGKIMERNRTIETLSVKNTGVKGAGFESFFHSLHNNKRLMLRDLSLSGNVLDSSDACSAFSKCLSSCLSSLVRLDIGNLQMHKRGLPGLLKSINETPNLTETLQELDISNNRLIESTAARLGAFLSSTKVLNTLSISGVIDSSNSLFGEINLAMANGSCLSLKKLDISKIKTKTNIQQNDLIFFLGKLPGIIDLNLAGTELSASIVLKITQDIRTLVTLDLSDNDLTDVGIITLCEAWINQRGTVDLAHLSLNRVFTPQRKIRTQAITALSALLSAIPLVSFYCKGSSKSSLKSDIMDLILSLINNTTLRLLDVSGHQAGDKFANAISKLIQHNNTLDTLFIDGNTISLKGLKLYRLGLERNGSLKHMPMPLADISKLLKGDDHGVSGPRSEVKAETAQGIRDTCSRIQRILFENALSFGQLTSVIVPEISESTNNLEPVWHFKKQITRPTASTKKEVKRFATTAVRKRTVSPLTISARDVMVPRASGYGTFRVQKTGRSERLAANFDTTSSHESNIREESEESPSEFLPRERVRSDNRRQLKNIFSDSGESQSFETRKTEKAKAFPKPKIDRSLYRVVGVDLFESLSPDSIPQEDIRRETRHWNNDFQQLCSRVPSLDKFVRLASLINDFNQHVSEMSKIIVNELHSVLKTIEPVEPNEYHYQGISFKIAIDYRVDDKFFYGMDSCSHKCAVKVLTNQWKGTKHYLNLTQILSQFNFLHFQLSSLVQYKGFTIIACALLPPSSEQPKPSNLSEEIKTLANKINLQLWETRDENSQSSNISIYGPERNVHWANDGRIYIIGLSSYMPPEYPTWKFSSLQKYPRPLSVLYNLLNPNFVSKWSSPLCVQGLTAWIQGDPKKESYNNTLREATKHIMEQVIPKFAQELANLPLPGDGEPLIELLHKRGLSARHMGRLRSLVTSPQWKSALLHECCSRTLKNIIRDIQMISHSGPVVTTSKILDHINSLLSVPHIEYPFFKCLEKPENLTIGNGLFTVIRPCHVVGPVLPSTVDSFYFEIHIKKITEPIQFAVVDDSQHELLAPSSLVISEPKLIGVYVNRKLSLVQYMLGAAGEVRPIKDPLLRLPLRAVLSGNGFCFEVNFGPQNFQFPIQQFCTSMDLTCPRHLDLFSSAFWSMSADASIQPNVKSFKNELISTFSFALTDEEDSSAVDLRSLLDGHKIVQKTMSSLGFVLSSSFQSILQRKQKKVVLLRDIIGQEPKVKGLLSDHIMTTASLSQFLTEGLKLEQLEEKEATVQNTLLNLTPLDTFISCLLSLQLVSFKDLTKKASILQDALVKCRQLRNEFSGQGLRAVIQVEAAIQIELSDSHEAQKLIPQIVAVSTPKTERRDRNGLLDIKNELCESTNHAKAKFLADCAKETFVGQPHFAMEFIVSHFSYFYWFHRRASDWDWKQLDPTLLAQALSLLEKDEIDIIFQVLMKGPFASGIMAKALNFISSPLEFQTSYSFYLLKSNPQICVDSPLLDFPGKPATTGGKTATPQVTPRQKGIRTSKSVRRLKSIDPDNPTGTP